MSDFNKELEFAFKEIQGSSGWSMDRNRPYDGQPHTDNGERGKTIVEGLTMRDIADCIVRGFLAAGGIQKENPIHDDLYLLDCQFSPGAVIRNAMCEVEKMMGIYPNVKREEER